MTPDNLSLMSAVEVARAVRERAVSAVEVVEAVLGRIERINPRLNAFCTPMPDAARAEARRADQAAASGDSLGPLHGVPVSVKDNIYVRDSRTTFGSKLHEHDVTRHDAPVVERLRRAGAIIIGRTNSPEFGWKGVTDNRVFGITRNPWNLALTPGGSSGGGAAAVAAGLGPIAIGTDGGGSLRIPASFCGLVGLKPSYGRVATWPGVSVGSLRHVGGMTRTVADSALLLNVVAGPDERDRESLPASPIDYIAELERGVAGLRIAYSPDLGFATVDDEVAALCRSTAGQFADAGALVETVDLDWPDPYDCWRVFFYGASAGRLGGIVAEQRELLDPGLRGCVEDAVQQTGLDFSRALNERNEWWLRVGELFDSFDLLVTPTLAVPPFGVGQDNAPVIGETEQGDLQWTQFTYPFNLTGQPAASAPCGWTKAGLPVGLQIIGPRFDDGVVLRAARAVEQIQPWADRWPDCS
ncbi:MAG: amidase [Pirellulaceae bacterium]|jgi:aspartyl-tRNA(Asn)/glutamyl-tRNA(Gln) amidotransferase subunit A|nr:amidase [Pirellulaceae bacterium]MDP7019146.1 amidase [Pirellulaceae bacterium]